MVDGLPELGKSNRDATAPRNRAGHQTGGNRMPPRGLAAPNQILAPLTDK